jgi:hypothetical protein
MVLTKNAPTKKATRIHERQFSVDVELPTLPNFIKVGGLMLPVKQIKLSVLRKIGSAWVAELVKRGMP